MPTCARKHQLNASLVYHVYNRSNNRISIFNREEDFCCFMDLIKEYSIRFGIKVYHWVIMPNHYHLLLEIEEPQRISNIMAGMAKAYSCYHHKVYSASGFLWQGRFKLQPVQKEEYLIACGRYIERNPVKAGMVDEAYGYPYSSARFYCLGESDGITVEDPALSEFGADLTCRRSAYKEFLRNFDDSQEQSFDNLEQPLGNKEFIRRLLKEKGHLIPRRRGRPSERIVA